MSYIKGAEGVEDILRRVMGYKLRIIIKDKLRRMMARPGDKLVEKNCSTCELNFSDVCVGHSIRVDNGEYTYGMPRYEAEKMFPKGCDDYGISLDAFMEQEKINGRHFDDIMVED